ncbi:MAG: hypothetical protein ABL876_16040 [Chitinophagaceae bacterium]
MAKIYSADEIVQLAKEIVNDLTNTAKQQEWTAAILQAPTESLVEVTGRLTSNEEHKPANIKALRESVISEIERKNAEKIIQTMQHLDQSASKLSNISLFLAVVGVVLGVIQILKEFNVI